MGADSKIEWCDHTFNPWVGCTKVSAACDHCYAESWAKRTGQSQLWTGERRRTSGVNWKQPEKWNRTALEKYGRPARVFCASLADVYDNQVPQEWRADLWTLISKTPNLTWMLLTKRPQNIAKMLPADWGDGYHNVWLGTTVENNDEATRRIGHLLTVKARKRFLSCEPLLGEVDLERGGFSFLTRLKSPTGKQYEKIDWVIAGGESGPGARPPRISWVRLLRDQCFVRGVPFHFKQWGEFTPDDPASKQTSMRRVGKKSAGRLLDGVQHDGFPS